jgi:hypothetical protein
VPGFRGWFTAVRARQCEVVLPCHLQSDPIADLQPPARGGGQQFAAAGPVGLLNLAEVGQHRSGRPIAQLVPRWVVVLRRLPVRGIAAPDDEPRPGAATPGRAPAGRLRCGRAIATWFARLWSRTSVTSRAGVSGVSRQPRRRSTGYAAASVIASPYRPRSPLVSRRRAARGRSGRHRR